MLNFPIKKTQTTIKPQKNMKKANLGMLLEEMINETNTYYLNNNIAVIHKKPIPIQIVKVNYPSRCEAIITEAYYKTPSTTDYNGIYKGRYIDFEAKNTKSKTSFPLSNVTKHQIEHLKKVKEHGGIAFFIIQFETLDLVFLVDSELIIDQYENGSRKSITIETIKEKGKLIERAYYPRLKYIDVIKEMYF